MYRITLPGSRVTLRPINPNDAYKIVQWRNTRDAREAFFNKHLVTPDSHAEFIDNRDKHDLVWIAENDGGLSVGMTAVKIHDTKYYIGEYGRTYVDEDFRGDKYAKEIEYLMLWTAFEWLKVNKLWLDAYYTNGKIINLHKRTGWTYVGKDVQGHTDPAGEVVHMDYERNHWKAVGRTMYQQDFDVELPGWIE